MGGYSGGLNTTSGVMGFAGGLINYYSTEDQLDADKEQAKSLLQQNEANYTSKVISNADRLTSVLAGVRNQAAGTGITMDSGEISEVMERNLNAFDQDQLSSELNYSFDKERIEERVQAQKESGEADQNSTILKTIGSFF